MTARDTRLGEAVNLRERGQTEEARQRLIVLTGEFPDDPGMQYQAAWAHDALGLEDGAVPYYERALDLGLPEPDRRGAMLGLGSSYRNVGRVADAVRLLEQAVADYPDDVAMRCFLALAQLGNADATTAVATLLTVILETSNSPDVERYRRALSWYRDDLLGIAIDD